MTRAGHIPQDVQFEAVIVPHRSLLVFDNPQLR